VLLGALQHGSCTVQPTKIAFTSEELVDMIHHCQLNRLNQFSTFLSVHLRNARQNLKLLGYLQSLDEILYSGLSLPREDEDWAFKNGLKVKVVLTLLASFYSLLNFSLLTRTHSATLNVEQCSFLWVAKAVMHYFFVPFREHLMTSYLLMPTLNLSQGIGHQPNYWSLSFSRALVTALIRRCAAAMATSIRETYSMK